MNQFHYRTLSTLLVLALVLVPTVVSSQENLRIREDVGVSIDPQSLLRVMVITYDCLLPYGQETMQCSDLGEGVQQTFLIMSMLEASCNAFYAQYGRMPDSLAELRESGLLLFEPAAQEYSPGLNLVGEDVEIRLASLSPQETDGGADSVLGVDWHNSMIPGLIVPAIESGAPTLAAPESTGRTLADAPYRLQRVEGLSTESDTDESGASDLIAEMEAWTSLHADINSNGIYLAGYDIEASPGPNFAGRVTEFSPVQEYPGSHWRGVGPGDSPVEAFPGSHWLELNYPGEMWALSYPQPEPPPGEVTSGLVEISYLNANYSLWKGSDFSYVTTLEENETALKITPWVMASQTPIEPGQFSLLSELSGSESPAVIKSLLVMESLRIIIDNYVGNNPTAPASLTELLGGSWIIDDNSYGNLASVGPGLPGSCKMIFIENMPSGERGIIADNIPVEQRGIIADNMPGDEEGIIIVTGRPGEEEGIIIVNGRPSELDPEFDVFFEVVFDSGEARLYQWVPDADGAGSSWLGIDPDEASGIIVIGTPPILDSSVAGWGFQTLTINRELLELNNRFIIDDN